MKKIKITINKGSPGKKFPVFNSPESLYVWMYDDTQQDSEKLDPSLGTMIHLRPGEVMEVEWMGCEYIYEEGFQSRVDRIRLAKTMQIKNLKSTMAKQLVGVYDGWVLESVLGFKSGSTEDAKITRLTARSKHKFDIAELFEARGISIAPEIEEETDPAKIH